MKKGDIEQDTLAWWLIALAVLVLVAAGYIFLSGKGAGIIEYIKELLRFRS